MTAVFKSSIYFWLAARGSNLDAGPWPCGTPVLHVMQGRRRSLPDSEPFAHLRYDKSHYCSRFVAARSLQVKLDLARSLGKLDLSDCNLDALPEEVTELTELEELSLSGNRLTELPESIGRLTSLRKLGLAGNQLRSLPETIGCLTSLQGLWLHGNSLRRLPDSLGSLSSLEAINLSGNFLEQLPDSITRLTNLDSLGLAGNRLVALPSGMGSLKSLTAMSLHGNAIMSLPDTFGYLARLESVSLQGNCLSSLPRTVGNMSSLKVLNVADNHLACLPDSICALPSLEALIAYGNGLSDLPALLPSPSLRHLWLEGNPLSEHAVHHLLRRASDPSVDLSALGLDETQLRGPTPTAPACLRPSRIVALDRDAPTHGYRKIAPAPARDTEIPLAHRALVVAFGSAPGDPNWGGLLKRVRNRMDGKGGPAFDILFVVDPHRRWYGGGDYGLDHYRELVRRGSEGYGATVLLGDSMGGSACLLMADLADVSLAFTPQTDLPVCSIKPGAELSWMETLKSRLRNYVRRAGEAGCSVRVCTGSWQHDLSQARVVEDIPGVDLEVFPFDSHRLAKWLDSQGRLEVLVEDAICTALGSGRPQRVRLANLL